MLNKFGRIVWVVVSDVVFSGRMLSRIPVVFVGVRFWLIGMCLNVFFFFFFLVRNVNKCFYFLKKITDRRQKNKLKKLKKEKKIEKKQKNQNKEPSKDTISQLHSPQKKEGRQMKRLYLELG